VIVGTRVGDPGYPAVNGRWDDAGITGNRGLYLEFARRNRGSRAEIQARFGPRIDALSPLHGASDANIREITRIGALQMH